MLVDFLAAGEQVWTSLIDAKEKTVDLETKEGVEELLALYERAESDYLSIPILQRHLEFLLGRHEYYSGEILKPDDLGDLFSTSWTRAAITEVVDKGVIHLTKVLSSHHEVTAVTELQDSIQVFFVARLGQAHTSTLPSIISISPSLTRRYAIDSEDTMEYYSSFTTNNRSPAQYEVLLSTASKVRDRTNKSFERREQFEDALGLSATLQVKSNYSLDDYARYIAYERRARNPDLFVMTSVFERAIAEAERRRFEGETGSEEALRIFWIGFVDVLQRINEAGKDKEFAVYRRAVRSVPICGEVWARYIRALERHELGAQVSDVYNQAFSTGLVQSDVEQVVPIVLAYTGYLRRHEEGDDILLAIIAVLEGGIDIVRKGAYTLCLSCLVFSSNTASKHGDPKLRLEKYLAAIYDQADLKDEVISVWEAVVKCNKSSYLVWTSYVDTLIKYQQLEKARQVFLDIHTKNLDWPEAIWEAWTNFEQMYGSIDGLDQCLDKVEKAQYQVTLRRLKEAEKSGYAMSQAAAGEQYALVAEATATLTGTDPAMDVDTEVPQVRGTKREADDEPVMTHKKVKIEQKPQPLKRDRENSTVFVGDLPNGATEEELTSLFKDCGNVREVKITQLPQALVATVEFSDRDSVPAALTKDKKKLRGQEVAVHLAWKSTLYVTNFPESADDGAIRDLFGQNSAEKALELHGRELEPHHSINVFISNPDRKKERTDQDANDREIYVAGLSKFTTQADLDKVFKTKDALAALDANNFELKRRRMAVTMADSRVRSKSRNTTTESGLSRAADIRNRSIRIRNLPANTQEGLLQQAIEKIAAVKRLEVFIDQNEAVVEFENAAEAGKLLLRTDPILFRGNTLQFSEEGPDSVAIRSAAPPPKAGGLFVPRAATSRPRAGLGHARKPLPSAHSQAHPSNPKNTEKKSTTSDQGKGQDDFRKMLDG
ncbi:hypothetical protein H0H93_001618 [Arthromyces matolae]|nr:hypothetical protein H0H93_001618 [Arthromyces matolae]